MTGPQGWYHQWSYIYTCASCGESTSRGPLCYHCSGQAYRDSKKPPLDERPKTG